LLGCFFSTSGEHHGQLSHSMASTSVNTPFISSGRMYTVIPSSNASSLARHPACRIVMEACCGAHWLARKLIVFGHQVQLRAPQYVRSFVTGNKNDFLDAQAICEAASHPAMRYIGIKTPEQQANWQRMRVMHRATARPVILPPPLAWCRASTPRVARASCWVSASGATSRCGGYWCNVPGW